MNTSDMRRANKMANGKPHMVIGYPDKNQMHIAFDGYPFDSPTCGHIVSVVRYPNILNSDYGIFEVEFGVLQQNGTKSSIKKMIGGRNLRFVG